MKAGRASVLLGLLENAPLIVFAGVIATFTAQSSRFLTLANMVNILIQSSSVVIVAIGMTFVLVTGGIDLSVGAIMFLSAAVAGKLIIWGWSVWIAFGVIVAVGVLYGVLNGLLITRLRILPFIVTLSTLFAGRGLSLLITQTRAMNLPGLTDIGSAKILAVPFPVWVFVGVLAVAYVVLNRTGFGRHVYAVGNDLEGAKKAGISTGQVLFVVYAVSGLCAAVGGLVLLSQLGAVSPKFGEQREFAAIAAAVLGGTSLFGGKGNVFPGTVLGAVLIQTVENGLVIVNADPYIYPLITSSIIFLAVLVDSLRHIQLQRLKRRKIRAETGG